MATVSAAAPGASSLHDLVADRRAHVRETAARKTGATRLQLGRFMAYAGVRNTILAATLIMLGTMLDGVGIVLIVPLLRLFFEPGSVQALAGSLPFAGLLEPLAPNALLSILFVGFMALLLLRALVVVARETLLARLQWGFIDEIKLGLFRRLAAASWKDVTAIERPRLNRALGGDMLQVVMAVNAAMQTGAATLMLVVYCTFAILLMPALSLPTFAIFALVGLAGTIYIRRARAFGWASVEFDILREESASRFLAGLKLAKAQDLEASFVDRFATASSSALATRVAFVRTMSTSRQLASVIGAITAAAAVVIGLLATDASPALLVTFVLLLARTTGPVSQIQQGIQQVANALPQFAELEDLRASLPEAPPPDPTRRAVADAACAISFRMASFTHRTTEGTPQGGVHAVNMDVAAAEFVGLSGPIGSGKSTLLDLVAGLENLQTGEVLFAGRGLAGPDLAAHRQRLAYLAADPLLFSGSLRSNLSWAAPDAADEAMWQALTVATAIELVDRLGDGLDSTIHEAGANLSAGEGQLVAIARALLRRPSLLLLDEATSSLDRDRERRVLANLRSLDPRPTILLVSHREESLAQCERVVTLSQGEIVSVRRIS